ncbi:hypothetical protein ACLMAJ_02590 [Nocardia sp. KC 131]|uniref:hypothetical protein n=1 Tax=Nocardia arseniciresistens TaxID=3392119 RepID=UPI00398E4193
MSLLTLVLLFQPWLTATGPAGDLSSNAFGQVDSTIPEVETLGYQASNHVSISGVWGWLAAVAALVAMLAAMLYLVVRSEALACLMAAASVFTAVFVLATLIYMNSKAPGLRDMTKHNDAVSGGIGNFLRKVFGDGEAASPEAAQQVASAALKSPALVGVMVAAAAALIAIAELRNLIRNAVVVAPNTEAASREHELVEHAEHAQEQAVDPHHGVSLDVLELVGHTVAADLMDAVAQQTSADPLEIKIVVTGHQEREKPRGLPWAWEVESRDGVNYDSSPGRRGRRREFELVLANANDVS